MRRTRPARTDPPLRIVPLGGLGEIGKNCTALQYGDDVVLAHVCAKGPSVSPFTHRRIT